MVMFSIPVFKKHQNSMRRRFFIFSAALFLLIFSLGSLVFIILMEQIQYDNAGEKLTKTIEIERLKLEASINSEIAIVLKMADSPLMWRYFLNPIDGELKKIIFEEIAGYRRAFKGDSVFWCSDIDKEFYFNEDNHYSLDIDNPDNYWYKMTLYETEKYNFNINYNAEIQKTMLWINAPVLDKSQKPAGMVGTGINLSDFINEIYDNHSGTEELFFFNAAGEITGTRDISLVKRKANITEVLGQTGKKIMDYARYLNHGEVKYFKTTDRKGIAAYSSIPALDWHIAVLHPYTVGESMQTDMAVLFGVMMAVIFSVFVFFNIFIIVILEPLNNMVKTINQTFTDLGMKPHEDGGYKDEIGTLGEFFHMTIIDPLTGIYNRRYLDGSLRKIIKLHSRTGGSLSLLMIDIDYFKKYNDTYGHDAGDDCLGMVVGVLSQCVIRDDDFIARFGGEEFAAVLPNTDENGARLVAERMLEKVRECNIPHGTSDIAAYVTVSIGGTTGIINHLQHGSDYIKAADKALYESKNNGRNRYTFKNLSEE
ncbi:MAG: diguanylate cyclase [Treponema sp.]|jgi:diguanylate cyclase (GGDEF)-like protein|nr:diguanylate cyclase [Treponema sp.]